MALHKKSSVIKSCERWNSSCKMALFCSNFCPWDVLLKFGEQKMHAVNWISPCLYAGCRVCTPDGVFGRRMSCLYAGCRACTPDVVFGRRMSCLGAGCQVYTPAPSNFWVVGICKLARSNLPTRSFMSNCTNPCDLSAASALPLVVRNSTTFFRLFQRNLNKQTVRQTTGSTFILVVDLCPRFKIRKPKLPSGRLSPDF